MRSPLPTIAVCSALSVAACRGFPTDAAAQARSLKPVPAGGDRAYVQVSAGFVHTCAIATGGAAYCWGNNDYSQLGSATGTEACGGRPCSTIPMAVSGSLHFVTLASGWVQNCGITTDGVTYCWGGGSISSMGYLGDGTVQQSSTPVRVRADSGFVAVTVGDGHACGLTASGMAFCWGQNSWGQVGDGTTEDRSMPVAVNTALRFRSLSAGAYHVCGITTANDAYCWGDNRWGELGSGDVGYNSMTAFERSPIQVEGQGFVSIAAGWEHTCALSTLGVALCWGRNEDANQLGDDSPITHRGTPAPVSGSLRFTALSAGALSTCGRTAEDEIYCWGGDYYGGLGNGETATRGVGHPVRTLGGPFERVAIGQSHACAIARDSRLWCWGDQSAGQF